MTFWLFCSDNPDNTLCGECRGMFYTCDIGTCERCDGRTSSGMFELCNDCSRILGECKACGVEMEWHGSLRRLLFILVPEY